MKNFFALLFRSSYLVLYFSLLFQAKIVLAQTPSYDLPQITVPDVNFTVKTPAGWRVRQNYRAKTLVFEDPMSSPNQTVNYHRNIAIAVQKEVRPIDGLEVERLNQKITREFASPGNDFMIIESRVIDYHKKADAILVFTTLTQAGVPMRQMHIFTSGSQNSVLLTFTDLESSFESEGSLDAVWLPMMSAELEGEAPHRFDQFMYIVSGMGFVVTAAYLSKELRSRQSRSELRRAEDSLYEDEDFDRDVEALLPPAPEAWQLAETQYAGRIA